MREARLNSKITLYHHHKANEIDVTDFIMRGPTITRKLLLRTHHYYFQYDARMN